MQPPVDLKIVILARPYLGHGGLPSAQICAVDITLRLLVGAQISAQTNQIAGKHGPLENAILALFGFLVKIDVFRIYLKKPSFGPFPGVYATRDPFQSKRNTNLTPGAHFSKFFIFSKF